MRLLANKVKNALPDNILKWSDLCSRVNEVEYLIPLDQQQLVQELENVGVGIQLDQDGVPTEIGLKK